MTTISPQTGTVTSVASSASSVQLFAAAGSVHGRAIYNDSTAVLYVAFAATASASAYTLQVAAGGYFEFAQPAYGGVVSGIWASANGNARLTSW